MSTFQKGWYRFRRFLLRQLVPEWIWPKMVSLDGVQFPVRGVDLNFGTKRWIANGLYECDERRLIHDVVKPGMTVVEMGGSIGILARILASKVGESGRVVSIEASPELFKIACTWCPVPSQLNFIMGYAFPLNDASSIHISEFKTDGSELDGRAEWEVDSKQTSPTVAWDFNRLGREKGIVPDVLVVDIEGGESVLRSLSGQIPSKTRHLVLEFHPQFYGSEGITDVTTCLAREGFSPTATSGQCTLFTRTD
ncbi:MAG: FkbM family methyltransferase [Schleiferiaceae bacterium]